MANPILDADILPLLGILLVSGVLAGTLAGLFGVGGGVVLVPALLYAFDFLRYDPLFTTHMAVGTSLAIIIPTAISSAQSHYRKGSVDLFLVRKLMIPVSIGAVVGSVIADRVGGDLLKGLYAVIALFLALNLFMKKSIILSEQLPSQGFTMIHVFVIGILSTMMGIAGGALFVPYFSAYNQQMLKAVGTSAALGLLIATPGTIGFALNGLDVANRPPFSFGYVSLVAFLCIIPMTILTAPLGAKMAHQMDKLMLKRLFALFLVAMSLRMFYKMFG